MRFEYSGDDDGIASAVEYCNPLLERDDFWSKVVASGPYDFTDSSAADIAAFARGYSRSCKILLFSARFRFRGTVAYVSPGHKDTIFMNTRFLGNSIAQKVNTLAHEYIHVTDYFGDRSPEIDYGHGSQSSSGKGRSAPYAIGDLAEAFYMSENPSFLRDFTPGELNFECDLGAMPEEFIVSSRKGV